ncbi:MAG: ChbG/HpnK family deacetylase [Spirosomataceae bacterium]
MTINTWKVFALLFLMGLATLSQAQETYAEKLGWPKGTKVVIFHVDDPGMSYSSNQGTIKSVEQGVATSCSIMFPCSWSASFVNYIHRSNPNLDAGVHLTLPPNGKITDGDLWQVFKVYQVWWTKKVIYGTK